MAQAVKRKRKEKELLSGATPKKLNLSVVPIAAGVAAASAPVVDTPDPQGNIFSIHKVRRKTRWDFRDEIEYKIYLELQRIQEEEQASRLAVLKDLKVEAGLVEVPEPSDLLAPAAAASPAPLDESEQLAAYLAHWNPMGCTKAIPTVKGTIELPDGTHAIVNKRQDFIDDGVEVLPYNGFRWDGLVTELTDDRAMDRRKAEHATARSQNSRKRLNKQVDTSTKNTHTIREYRPVPDVMWFLNNPDGKSNFRGDLNPYPPGRVPAGDELASYHEAKKQHAMQVAAFSNFNQWCKKTCDNMLKDASRPDEIPDWMCRSMQAHDARDLAIMQERFTSAWDDLPWSYAEPVEVSDQVSQPQRSDASEGSPQPGNSNPLPLPEDQLLRIRSDTKKQYYKSFRMRQESEAVSDKPEPVETVIVAADGRAFPVGKVLPEQVPSIAAQVSTMQPQRQTRQERDDLVKKLSLDLRDPKAAPMLRILERRIRADIKDLQSHLWNVVGARMLAEQYRKTGSFEQTAVDQPLDVTHTGPVIEPVPYVAPVTEGKHIPRRSTQYWPTPKGVKARFAAIMRRSEELQLEQQIALLEWDDRKSLEAAAIKRYLKARAKHVSLERASIAKIGGKQRLRRKAGTLEKLEARSYVLQRYVKEHKRQMLALERHQAAVREWLTDEVRFYRALGIHNQFFHGPITRTYKRKEMVRKAKGKVRRFFNLGPKERHVQHAAPSTVPERPVNQPVMPVVTLLPARTPSEPKPEPEKVTTLVLPKTEVVTFSQDQLTQSLRRAHMMRLARTGQFTAAELKEADKIFTTMVA